MNKKNVEALVLGAKCLLNLNLKEDALDQFLTANNILSEDFNKDKNKNKDD